MQREAAMRAAWHGCLVGLTLALFSAGAHAQSYGFVYRGNDTGGIIPWSCEAEAQARDIAGAFCASYNKFARITSVHRMYGDYIAFHCLWRPDTARYQIPVVRTRASCPAYDRTQRFYPREMVR